MGARYGVFCELTHCPWGSSCKLTLVIFKTHTKDGYLEHFLWNGTDHWWSSQHWFRKWLVAIRQKAIIWATVNPVLCCHMASPCRNVRIPPQPKEFHWFLNWQECVTDPDCGGVSGLCAGYSENLTFMGCKPEPIPCCQFLYGRETHISITKLGHNWFR